MGGPRESNGVVYKNKQTMIYKYMHIWLPSGDNMKKRYGGTTNAHTVRRKKMRRTSLSAGI